MKDDSCDRDSHGSDVGFGVGFKHRRSDGANENMRRDQVLDQEIDVRFS